ncbi:SPASM domain-containing protein [Clostridium perfringens]|nr:SPASM domain-containing protein [Clostridium perfringens]
MKLSQFNIKKEINGNIIIYNTLSSGILMLNPEYSRYYSTLEKNGFVDKSDLLSELKKGGMLINKDIDEIGALNLESKFQRYSSESLSLTIAPTLECNFACPYCYEEGHRYSEMDENIQKDLINFLNNFPNIKNLNISWYGGEPLLKLNLLESITKQILDKLSNVNFNANIVTNGYYLTKENAIRLKNINVSHVQVTLDGNKETHDKRRILLNGNGTFEKILNNIKESCEILPIVIRINVDKENITNIFSLIELLKEENLLNKVGFYLAPVDNSNNTCKSNTCFTIKDFSKEEISFYEKCLSLGVNSINIPKTTLGICGAISKNSYVISPTGELYKCWNEIGRKEYSIGNLKDKLKANFRLTKWLQYDPLKEYPECTSCKFLPTCFGGCPYNYMQNIEKKCISMLFNSEKTIELLYSLNK